MKELSPPPYFSDWPRIESAIESDPLIEQEVGHIVSLMTLEEKVGQMIQPNLRDITPEELRQYKLGSILNGGGSWPNEEKHSNAIDWAEKADEFWLATEHVFSERPFRIPFIWATDAVHGHNNAFGATVFPHNIGLGATRDTNLIERIGEATAIEVCATGLDWTFAPTVAVPRDLRWGRVYEGYSEDPEITYAYAAAMVKGLQGDAEDLQSDCKVISNVKHWVGDGGTLQGIDRGQNTYSEDYLRNIHAIGYFSGLNAGAQVVMTSFNTWENDNNYDHDTSIFGIYNKKLHGSHYLITDVLKGKMAFDGLVVTDWHGHSEVSKCTDNNATYAINAGNDILMVPVRENWTQVYKQTLADIENGNIPITRINDAVTRILRVKMRAGLWHKPKPSDRQLAGKASALCNKKHQALAREAVRKSLVLLKNQHNVLPLANHQKVLLTGSAADDIQKQAGGWNLTWQGDENCLEDFPNASTVKTALERQLESDKLIYDPNLVHNLADIDVAIVVFGEDPYAEMMGDIKEWQTLEYSSLKRSYKKDVQKINHLHANGIKVISIFFSGRPLYVNEEISKSSAFIAAFLPGTEGDGIADLIVGDKHAKPRYNFVGKLSYSWPNNKNSACINRIPHHIPNYRLPNNEQDPKGNNAPLFPYGYGLSYYSTEDELAIANTIELDTKDSSHLKHGLALLGVKMIIGDYQMRAVQIVNNEHFDISRNNPMSTTWLSTTPYNYQLQQDAIEVAFNNVLASFTVQTSDDSAEDISQYQYLKFDALVSELPTKPVWVSIYNHQLQTENTLVDIQNILVESKQDWVEIKIPLQKFNISSNHCTNTPFSLTTEGKLKLVIANVRLTLE